MDQGKVFISSILDPKKEDLREERKVVKEVVDSYTFLTPWAFEHEPASVDPLEESYLRNIDGCDLFILVLGAESTEPVATECLRAIDRGKPILIFAKKVQERTAQAAVLLKTPGTKYDEFTSLPNLQQQVRDAITDTLVKGLRALGEDAPRTSVLGSLRQLAQTGAVVRISPTIPRAAEAEDFRIQGVDGKVLEVRKESSSQRVHIPLIRVPEVLPAFPNDPAKLHLEGRLQWVTTKKRWAFYPEKPQSESQFGIPKVSSLKDPHSQGLSERLRQQEYDCGWGAEDSLVEKLAQGWEIVYNDDGKYFRISDRPSNLILICRPKK